MSSEDGSHARWKTGFLIQALERTRSGPQKPLEALQTLRHAQEDVYDAIGLWVAAARRDGYSWSRIGEALSISKQAAQKAYARREEALYAAHINVRYERLPVKKIQPRRRGPRPQPAAQPTPVPRPKATAPARPGVWRGQWWKRAA